jgi:hypothetical protein
LPCWPSVQLRQGRVNRLCQSRVFGLLLCTVHSHWHLCRDVFTATIRQAKRMVLMCIISVLGVSTFY